MKRSFALAALLCGAAFASFAQNASVPLSLVVPYPAGGPLHTSAQMLAQGAQQALGTITVTNKPGAGGATGADLIAKAKPNENLVVMGAVATHAILPHLGKPLAYDAQKDFKPLFLVARVPNVLVFTKARAAELKLNNVSDLVAYLKANPNGLKMGTPGNGSIGHIAGEMLKSLANVRMPNREYVGAAAAQKGLLSGEVDLVFDNLASALPLVQSGELVALAVTTPSRSIALRDVPSVNEALPGFDVSTWFGVFAPTSLPDVDARNYVRAFQAALNDPKFKDQYLKMGIVPQDMRLQEFADFVKLENRKFQFLISATKINAS